MDANGCAERNHIRAFWLCVYAEHVSSLIYVLFLFDLTCFRSARKNSESLLISGSGDGEVKIWQVTQNASQLPDAPYSRTDSYPELLKVLESEQDAAVLSVIVHDGTIYAGYQGGSVLVSARLTRRKSTL